MRPTIYLFDIDGTLLDGRGAGRAAMEAAFARLHGSAAPLSKFRFAGMTDRAIVRTALFHLDDRQVQHVERSIDEVLEAYLVELPEAIARTPGYGLHPGVLEILEALERQSAIAVGLGTGNVRRGAMLKLAPLDVADRFAFGGFGCDAEERAALIRTGAQRGAERLDVALDACRVVVIGDTPLDVSAARAIGAECLGVGTSYYSAEALRDSGAQAAVESLRDPAALAFLLPRG